MRTNETGCTHFTVHAPWNEVTCSRLHDFQRKLGGNSPEPRNKSFAEPSRLGHRGFFGPYTGRGSRKLLTHPTTEKTSDADF